VQASNPVPSQHEVAWDDGGLGQDAELGALVISTRCLERALIKAGADVHFRSEAALLCAVEQVPLAHEQLHGLDVVEVLLSAGADVCAQDHLALLLAVRSGHVRLIELLIRFGADLSARGGYILSEARIAAHRFPELQVWLQTQQLDVVTGS